MIAEIELLMEKYRRWLADRTALREVNGHVEITTPYLDRHNDYIQIYARKDREQLVLTDGGETIDDLAMSGCSLDSPKRQELLKLTLAGFGVENQGGQLCVKANGENFAVRKHNLIQAVLAVNDLFYLAQPMVASLFWEDVAAWLDELDVRYTPRVQFKGKSGYDHQFDFAIPKSKAAPERIIRTINNPTRDAAQNLVLAWVDTRESRPADSRAFAIMNDREKRIGGGVTDALRNYEITPVLWSERSQISQVLAA